MPKDQTQNDAEHLAGGLYRLERWAIALALRLRRVEPEALLQALVVANDDPSRLAGLLPVDRNGEFQQDFPSDEALVDCPPSRADDLDRQVDDTLSRLLTRLLDSGDISPVRIRSRLKPFPILLPATCEIIDPTPLTREMRRVLCQATTDVKYWQGAPNDMADVCAKHLKIWAAAKRDEVEINGDTWTTYPEDMRGAAERIASILELTHASTTTTAGTPRTSSQAAGADDDIAQLQNDDPNVLLMRAVADEAADLGSHGGSRREPIDLAIDAESEDATRENDLYLDDLEREDGADQDDEDGNSDPYASIIDDAERRAAQRLKEVLGQLADIDDVASSRHEHGFDNPDENDAEDDDYAEGDREDFGVTLIPRADPDPLRTFARERVAARLRVYLRSDEYVDEVTDRVLDVFWLKAPTLRLDHGRLSVWEYVSLTADSRSIDLYRAAQTKRKTLDEMGRKRFGSFSSRPGAFRDENPVTEEVLRRLCPDADDRAIQAARRVVCARHMFDEAMRVLSRDLAVQPGRVQALAFALRLPSHLLDRAAFEFVVDRVHGVLPDAVRHKCPLEGAPFPTFREVALAIRWTRSRATTEGSVRESYRKYCKVLADEHGLEPVAIGVKGNDRGDPRLAWRDLCQIVSIGDGLPADGDADT